MAFIGTGVEYGLHCLLWLVERPSTSPSSRDLAELQGIRPRSLPKSCRNLRRPESLQRPRGCAAATGSRGPPIRSACWMSWMQSTARSRYSTANKYAGAALYSAASRPNGRQEACAASTRRCFAPNTRCVTNWRAPVFPTSPKPSTTKRPTVSVPWCKFGCRLAPSAASPGGKITTDHGEDGSTALMLIKQRTAMMKRLLLAAALSGASNHQARTALAFDPRPLVCRDR